MALVVSSVGNVGLQQPRLGREPDNRVRADRFDSLDHSPASFVGEVDTVAWLVTDGSVTCSPFSSSGK